MRTAALRSGGRRRARRRRRGAVRRRRRLGGAKTFEESNRIAVKGGRKVEEAEVFLQAGSRVVRIEFPFMICNRPVAIRRYNGGSAARLGRRWNGGRTARDGSSRRGAARRSGGGRRGASGRGGAARSGAETRRVGGDGAERSDARRRSTSRAIAADSAHPLAFWIRAACRFCDGEAEAGCPCAAGSDRGGGRRTAAAAAVQALILEVNDVGRRVDCTHSDVRWGRALIGGSLRRRLEEVFGAVAARLAASY